MTQVSELSFFKYISFYNFKFRYSKQKICFEIIHRHRHWRVGCQSSCPLCHLSLNFKSSLPVCRKQSSHPPPVIRWIELRQIYNSSTHPASDASCRKHRHNCPWMRRSCWQSTAATGLSSGMDQSITVVVCAFNHVQQTTCITPSQDEFSIRKCNGAVIVFTPTVVSTRIIHVIWLL